MDERMIQIKKKITEVKCSRKPFICTSCGEVIPKGSHYKWVWSLGQYRDFHWDCAISMEHLLSPGSPQEEMEAKIKLYEDKIKALEQQVADQQLDLESVTNPK